MNNYLKHHGIPGMKWGKKNGPPYPLNYSDLSAEERDKAKEKAIREGNIKEAAKNRVHFTDHELTAVKNRYNLNTEVSRLAAADIKTGRQKVEQLSKNMELAIRVGENGTKLYNVYAKTMNAFNPEANLPLIGQNQGGKKKKKK